MFSSTFGPLGLVPEAPLANPERQITLPNSGSLPTSTVLLLPRAAASAVVSIHHRSATAGLQLKNRDLHLASCAAATAKHLQRKHD